MQKKVIIYITIIIVILVLVFLSQQPYSRNIIKNITSYINKYAGASLMGGFGLNYPSTNSSNNTSAKNISVNSSVGNSTDSYKLTESAYNSSNINNYAAKAADVAEQTGLTLSNIPGKVVQGIKSGGEAISSGISSATEKISENISTAEKNVVNYFSGISNAIQGKEINSDTCQCPAGQ